MRARTRSTPPTAARPPCRSSDADGFALTVTKRSTSTTVTCSPASVAFGQASTCTTVVSDSDSGTKSFPTGTVTLSAAPAASGTFSSTTCTLAQVGATTTSSCDVTYTPSANAGTHTINASYGGSAAHAVSSDADGFALTVTKRSTSTTIACPASLALHETGSPARATVSDTDAGDKAAPTGSVTFTLDPSSVAGATGHLPRRRQLHARAGQADRQLELLGQLHARRPPRAAHVSRAPTRAAALHESERRQRRHHRHQALDLDHRQPASLAAVVIDQASTCTRHRLRHLTPAPSLRPGPGRST